MLLPPYFNSSVRQKKSFSFAPTMGLLFRAASLSFIGRHKDASFFVSLCLLRLFLLSLLLCLLLLPLRRFLCLSSFFWCFAIFISFSFLSLSSAGFAFVASSDHLGRIVMGGGGCFTRSRQLVMAAPGAAPSSFFFAAWSSFGVSRVATTLSALVGRVVLLEDEEEEEELLLLLLSVLDSEQRRES